MLWGQQARTTNVRVLGIPSTGFLDRLASELKIGRPAAYRHAVQHALEIVKKNYESGQYRSTTEAEYMLRKLADREQPRP